MIGPTGANKLVVLIKKYKKWEILVIFPGEYHS